ncbi:uncharacterized protein LOC18009068 isoform X2 [Eutrema salsugineum]|nr:uncharacterized protein LOC18009068 isoform X2 [Eutrema salsugineum]
MDFAASCKGMKNDKQCTINYCHKCLQNRYGEKAEEVATSSDWLCPKCRGICNCSFCRKQRGQNPTGILAHKAKASGLSSVSELLEVEGNDNFAYQKKAKQEDVSMEGRSVELIDVPKVAAKIKKPKATKKVKDKFQFEAQVELPQGISLTNVSGIDIPTEETGNVLQFLEFCSAFGKVLGVKEGQAESVVAELFSCGRNTKRQQYGFVVPMMIRLVAIISQDRDMSLSLSETDGTWFSSVGECLLQSGVLSDDFSPETFKSGVSEYKKMDASTRLKLLNLLCDESLGTWAMRNFMENELTESETKKREAKQKAAAAKQKEKQLRQKMQGDLVKAHMEKNGAPLSIEEHKAMLSQIKAEAKEARGEMLEAKGMTSRKNQKCDALRTDPILLNDGGRVLWKLNCFNEEPKFLVQDLGTFDDMPPHENWLAFKPEQKQEIEKYMKYTSANRMRK